MNKITTIKFFVYINLPTIIICWLLFFTSIFFLTSQDVTDSTINIPVSDTTFSSDTGIVQIADTIPVKKKKKEGLEAPVKYTAKDSVIYDLDSQYVYLYGTGVVTYEDITLEADYIRFDMTKKEVFSKGMPDSAGNISGNPVFKQGSDEYKAKILNYNFDTRKAYIESIITEQQGGFLHSEQSKRQSNEHIHALNNKYTTCDLEHPHFYIALKKAIIVPNKKIISGPAYFVVEDVPLYFPFLPFGFFPTPKKRSAGILVPALGDEATRGFYLRDLGYYWPINDYVDLTLMSELYTKGDWGLNVNTYYVKRYKFNGSFTFDFRKSYIGDRDIDPDKVKNFYNVIWTHNQDPKANPTQTFSAKVNISTTGFDRDYSRDVNEMFSNQKNSSISYTKKWDNTPLNTPFNISASMNHSQHSQTKIVNVRFPNISANSGNIYIIPKKDDESKRRFYHDIRTKYTARFENSYQNADTTFWDNMKSENMETGFKHSLPITLPAKIFKSLPLNISIGYEGYLFTKRIEYFWDESIYSKTSKNDSIPGDFNFRVKDTLAYLHKFNYVPSFNNLTLNRNLYVIFQSKKSDSKVQALRYVMLPKASVSITPGRKGKTPKYYREVENPNDPDNPKFYSIFENAKSGFSPPGITKSTTSSGSINLSLDNNIEMKIRSKNDTVEDVTKVKVLDNLSFNTRYNIFADSLNWSTINFNTGTSILKKAISMRINGVLDPYCIDDLGRKVNKFELNENSKLGRLTSLRLNMSFNFGSKRGKESQKETEDKSEKDLVKEYDYFDVPWSFSAQYSWSYSKPADIARITQTLSFNGKVKFTQKWDFTYSSGYDFQNKEFTTTYFNITRDLHCWTMNLKVVPFGTRRYFEFRINAISSMLKDLKYDFDRNWRDDY